MQGVRPSAHRILLLKTYLIPMLCLGTRAIRLSGMSALGSVNKCRTRSGRLAAPPAAQLVQIMIIAPEFIPGAKERAA